MSVRFHLDLFYGASISSSTFLKTLKRLTYLLPASFCGIEIWHPQQIPLFAPTRTTASSQRPSTRLTRPSMSIASHLANVPQFNTLTTLTAGWMLQRTCFANAASMESPALQILSPNLCHSLTRIHQEPNASAESLVWTSRCPRPAPASANGQVVPAEPEPRARNPQNGSYNNVEPVVVEV